MQDGNKAEKRHLLEYSSKEESVAETQAFNLLFTTACQIPSPLMESNAAPEQNHRAHPEPETKHLIHIDYQTARNNTLKTNSAAITLSQAW